MKMHAANIVYMHPTVQTTRAMIVFHLVFPHVTFHGISITHVRSQGRVMEMVEWNGNGRSFNMVILKVNPFPP